MFSERALALGAALLATLSLSGCLDARDEARAGERGGCDSCHGSADPALPALARSAPPRDLLGNTTREYPGVGAHAAHVRPSGRSAPVACETCHEVPASTGAPGHADTAAPAEVRLSALASAGGRAPAYDPAGRRCGDTYCHGEQSPPWTEPAPAPCGGCHGAPPPAPHPQSEQCAACHGEVIGPDGAFVAPERHVDGRLDVGAERCDGCHGSADDPAPPPALSGATAASERGVGAHQAHLAGGAQSRPVACSECHPVPSSARVHPEGDGLVVTFAGAALAGGAAPVWRADTGGCSGGHCHDPSQRPESEVLWTHGQPLECTGCHGLPPGPPHPQMPDCALCHADVFSGELGAIADRERHVDGVLDVAMPTECTSCHGGAAPTSPAPPSGAHAAHVQPAGPARPVPCGDCHAVPATVLSPGHVDSDAPAEVLFSGVASAFEAAPSYGDATCRATFCHGDSFVGGRPSGGVDTVPVWVAPSGGSALSCQSCHGMPPPPPHPADEACASCHQNLDAEGTFLVPESHIDGSVTFFLQ